MEKLFLTVKNGSITHQLFLPSSKQPVPLPNSEPAKSEEEKRRSHISDDTNSLNWIINKAVLQTGTKIGHHRAHNRHNVVSEFRKYLPNSDCWKESSNDFDMPPIDEPGALNFILSRHPFPLGQGPVIMPLDESFKNQTLFTHEDTQECLEWVPVLTGNNAWSPDSLHVHNVHEPVHTVKGPASTMTMGVLYTCSKLTCVVHCPCSICQDKRNNCQLSCRGEVCNGCNSQCLKHQIQLPRLFDSESDLFTLVTNRLGCYRFGIPYAGIPSSCAQCTKDVLEHQIFHLVFHSRCRFCRNDLRPFERRNILTYTDYLKANKLIEWVDNKTCAFCLVKCSDKYEREKHEESVHKNNGKYKCETCEKTYSNKNALSYHVSNKHEESNKEEKPCCKLCPSEFTTEANLQKHVETVHTDTSQFDCEECGVKFNQEKSLNRHKKENHYNLNVNLDFVEDFNQFLQMKCDQCDKTFKRKYQLQRHVKNVHCDHEQKQFNCPQCDKTYKTPDTLRRHMKEKHKE